METKEVGFLINQLRANQLTDYRLLANNLVYYIPRIQNEQQLTEVVNILFNSPSILSLDPSTIVEIAQSIFQWKLQISEPSLSLSTFWRVWDYTISRSSKWNLKKLSMLSGILSTQPNFITLQHTFFLDNLGMIESLYKKWRKKYFIPIWTSLLREAIRNNSTVDILVQLYCINSIETDLKDFNYIPWPLVTESCIRSVSTYINEFGKDRQPILLIKNINHVARTLQFAPQKVPFPIIEDLLLQISVTCKELSMNEYFSSMPNKDYSGEYYGNIILTTVLTFRGLIVLNRDIPDRWYLYILLCLFHLNFITRDYGVIGFQSYEIVYQASCHGIAKIMNDKMNNNYYELLQIMDSEIIRTLVHPNKINDSKLLFLMDYLEQTINIFEVIDVQYINSKIKPLVFQELCSKDREIRESAHSVALSLFRKKGITKAFRRWQVENIQKYFGLSLDQFTSGNLSTDQLMIIAQTIGGNIPTLEILSPDISRIINQMTYLKIINCKSNEVDFKYHLLKCLLYQLPYINDKHICDWLDNILELLGVINFDKSQFSDIIDCLWKVLSRSRSDICLRWWYMNMIPIKSLL